MRSVGLVITAARNITLAIISIVLLSSCAQNDVYRKEVVVRDCGTLKDEKDDDSPCQRAQIKKYITKEDMAEYYLGFVELTDQGEFHNRSQLSNLQDTIARLADPDGAIIIVFVHGWRHNAQVGDDNVRSFSGLLEHTQEIESAKAKIRCDEREKNTEKHAEWSPPATSYVQCPNNPGKRMRLRTVIGIYVGWRGALVQEEGWGSVLSGILRPLAILSFWNRMDAAQRVAQGSVRELLAGLNKLQININAQHDRRHDEEFEKINSGVAAADDDWTGAGPSRRDVSHATRMITIGHSFGGLIVYEALSEHFIDGVTFTPGIRVCDHSDLKTTDVPGFGDIVFLLNPAFEGMRYDPIDQAVSIRNDCYKRYQSPILVAITSESDEYTKTAFHWGRLLATLFTQNCLNTYNECEKTENAVGHIESMKTHTLTGEKRVDVSLDSNTLYQECMNFQAFDARQRPDGVFRNRWTRRYNDGTTLELVDTERKDGHNQLRANTPFWVVSADPSVMNGHNDLNNRALFGFIRQVISDYDRETVQREKLEARQTNQKGARKLPEKFTCPSPRADK